MASRCVRVENEIQKFRNICLDRKNKLPISIACMALYLHVNTDGKISGQFRAAPLSDAVFCVLQIWKNMKNL